MLSIFPPKPSQENGLHPIPIENVEKLSISTEHAIGRKTQIEMFIKFHT